jgi:hypothetical protein
LLEYWWQEEDFSSERFYFENSKRLKERRNRWGTVKWGRDGGHSSQH